MNLICTVYGATAAILQHINDPWKVIPDAKEVREQIETNEHGTRFHVVSSWLVTVNGKGECTDEARGEGSKVTRIHDWDDEAS
jgi:hypothetical protein